MTVEQSKEGNVAQECPVCGKGALHRTYLLECDNCETELLADGEIDARAARVKREPVEQCVARYRDERGISDDPKENARLALLYADTMGSSHTRALLYVLARGISDSPTWIKFDSMDHATDPKDGETVLGWWAPVAATGYRGGMESVTFGAADEDGRSDTWTNAFGDSTDPPDYWTRLRGPK